MEAQRQAVHAIAKAGWLWPVIEHVAEMAAAAPAQDFGTVHEGAVIGPGDDRVRVLRLVPKVPRRVVAVVWHRDRHRSPAARAFVEIARDVAADVERELVEP